MFSVNDKIYYYLEAKRKHYPGIVLAISPTDYVIKYFDELGAYHIVKDVQEQLLDHRKEEAGGTDQGPVDAGQQGVNRNPVRLLVVQCHFYTFKRIHSCMFLSSRCRTFSLRQRRIYLSSV